MRCTVRDRLVIFRAGHATKVMMLDRYIRAPDRDLQAERGT
jgi:hypothetical protein